MGLLDDLLGQVAGSLSNQANANTQSAPSPGTETRGGANMTTVMAALLPVVLGMLASGQRAQQPSALDQRRTGGGLGDILGQVLGGSGGGGGLGGLLEGFQRAGFGDQVRSWVSTGANQAIPPEAVEKVFGSDGVAEIARRAGVSEQDASRGLSQLMPEVVDRMTPNGQLPDATSLLASVESFAKRLGAR